MTAAELAKSLKLSRTTVSLVLNSRGEDYGISPETIQRVREAARVSKYTANPVARQLAGKRSNAIGVLINTASLVDPRLIQKMEMLASQRQLRFIVGYAVGNEREIRTYVEDFRARGVDAIIALNHNHPASRNFIYDELSRAGRVLYFYKPQAAAAENAWFVEPDFHEVGRLATQHLVDRGRRRVALTCISEATYPIMRPRQTAYAEVLRASGMEYDPDLVWKLDEQTSSHWTDAIAESDAEAIVNELVVRRGADAIVSTSDLEAIRLVTALRQAGRRVPDDVAVVGTDNLGVASLVPPYITNIDLRLDALAEASVNLLFEMIEAKSGAAGRGIVVKPTLIARQSS
jgi:DNA-binding LacI/PurR family transcriptional regulator